MKQNFYKIDLIVYHNDGNDELYEEFGFNKRDAKMLASQIVKEYFDKDISVGIEFLEVELKEDECLFPSEMYKHPTRKLIESKVLKLYSIGGEKDDEIQGCD